MRKRRPEHQQQRRAAPRLDFGTLAPGRRYTDHYRAGPFRACFRECRRPSLCHTRALSLPNGPLGRTTAERETRILTDDAVGDLAVLEDTRAAVVTATDLVATAAHVGRGEGEKEGEGGGGGDHDW